MNRRELAQAMRDGINRPEVVECWKYFIEIEDASCLVCALGAAYVSHYNGDSEAAEREFDNRFASELKAGWQIIAEALGVSNTLARQISLDHSRGRSIEQIAQWLESDPNWAEGWEVNNV